MQAEEPSAIIMPWDGTIAHGNNLAKEFNAADFELLYKINNESQIGSIQSFREKCLRNILQLQIELIENEVDKELRGEEFLNHMLSLEKIGVPDETKTFMRNRFNKIREFTTKTNYDDFYILPLPAAEEPECLYFRNKSGLFLGELKPFLSLVDKETANADGMNYWSEWKTVLPQMQFVDVDADSHMTFLKKPDVNAYIAEKYNQLLANL